MRDCRLANITESSLSVYCEPPAASELAAINGPFQPIADDLNKIDSAESDRAAIVESAGQTPADESLNPNSLSGIESAQAQTDARLASFPWIHFRLLAWPATVVNHAEQLSSLSAQHLLPPPALNLTSSRWPRFILGPLNCCSEYKISIRSENEHGFGQPVMLNAFTRHPPILHRNERIQGMLLMFAVASSVTKTQFSKKLNIRYTRFTLVYAWIIVRYIHFAI